MFSYQFFIDKNLYYKVWCVFVCLSVNTLKNAN
jgi:hypothetical protein